ASSACSPRRWECGHDRLPVPGEPVARGSQRADRPLACRRPGDRAADGALACPRRPARPRPAGRESRQHDRAGPRDVRRVQANPRMEGTIMKTTAPIEAKVAAGGITGAIVTIVIAALRHWVPGFTITPELVAGITAIASFGAGYLTRHTARTLP